jgi:modulator of FtsH protease
VAIGEWSTLLAVEAGSAATLTGLVFVALSVNLPKIMAFPGLPGRAAESMLQFLEVFLIATVALVPGQDDRTLAIEFIAIGFALWLAQIAGQIRYLRLRTGHPWSWFLYRAVFGQLATVPFCVVGIALLTGAPNAFYWLVPGFVFSFIAGGVSSWVLLVEIQR